MTYTVTAPSSTQPKTAPASKTAPAKPSLDNAISAALEHARRLTAMYGTANTEVAIAWETVEELQVARSRQPQQAKTSLERYCDANPEAPECRIYED
jgi:hypothetical protein